MQSCICIYLCGIVYPGIPASRSPNTVFIDGQTTKNERYKIYVRSTKIQWMDKLAVNHFWKTSSSLHVSCVRLLCVVCVCAVCRIFVDLSFASRCTSEQNWKKQTEQNERIETTTFWPEANTFRNGICVAKLSFADPATPSRFPLPTAGRLCTLDWTRKRHSNIWKYGENLYFIFSSS